MLVALTRSARTRPLDAVGGRRTRLWGGRVATILVLSVASAACGSAPSPPGAGPRVTDDTAQTGAPATARTAPGGSTATQEVLVPSTSCGDAIFLAATASDDRAIRVRVDGVLAAAASGPVPFERTYEVGEAGVEVTLLEGTALSTAVCNDLPAGDHRIDREVPATRATVVVRVPNAPVAPAGACGGPVDASSTLVAATFDVDGTTTTFEDVTVDGPIGWCAG